MAVSAVAWVLILRMPGALQGRHHSGTDSYLVAAGSWLLMVVAMMGPAMVPRVRHVAQCCVGRARTHAIAETLTGALLIWTAVGVLVVGLVTVSPVLDAGNSPVAFGVAWLLVAGWQLSASKVSALARCHAIRIPRGVADGRGRLTAGVAYSGWCVVSCGPAMVAMALTGHPLLLMIVLTIGLIAERVAHRPVRVARRLAAGIALTAAACLVLAFVGA
ncbi:copper chaperone [Nakamurella sp. GG22]